MTAVHISVKHVTKVSIIDPDSKGTEIASTKSNSANMFDSNKFIVCDVDCHY